MGDGEKYLCPNDVEEGEGDGVPASQVRLDEVLAAPGDSLTYMYDYGDGWEHRLVVEEAGPAVDDVRLLSGHGAAPPEDSGGIWDWDADAAPPFDLAEAQAALAVWSVNRSVPPELHALQQHLWGSPHEAALLELLAAAALDRPIPVDDVAETRCPDTGDGRSGYFPYRQRIAVYRWLASSARAEIIAVGRKPRWPACSSRSWCRSAPRVS